jgi:hypothetical protein
MKISIIIFLGHKTSLSLPSTVNKGREGLGPWGRGGEGGNDVQFRSTHPHIPLPNVVDPDWIRIQ